MDSFEGAKSVHGSTLLRVVATSIVSSAKAEKLHETTTPGTYLIDYGDSRVDNPEYDSTVSQAPSRILHVGHDVVFRSVSGASRGFNPFVYKRPTAEVCHTEMARVRRHVDPQTATRTYVVEAFKWEGVQ